jgi:SHS2 domain-containing protein
MYETFEHTADLGLRIRAEDLDALFVEAGCALMSALVENPDAIQPVQTVTIRLPPDQPDLLLFDWLREILYQFDVHHLVFGSFTVKVTDSGLDGSAQGEPFDRARHLPLHEVKAITYHGLRVEQADDGWLAEVIVDI